MKIVSKAKDNKKIFNDLEAGDVFEFSNQVFMKIATFSCINMENGRVADIRGAELVKKLNVTLVIGE